MNKSQDLLPEEECGKLVGQTKSQATTHGKCCDECPTVPISKLGKICQYAQNQASSKQAHLNSTGGLLKQVKIGIFKDATYRKDEGCPVRNRLGFLQMVITL